MDIIVTDHYGLQFLSMKKETSCSNAALVLIGTSLIMITRLSTRKERKNLIADPLSRLISSSQLDNDDSHDIGNHCCTQQVCASLLQQSGRNRGQRREYLVRWNNQYKESSHG